MHARFLSLLVLAGCGPAKLQLSELKSPQLTATREGDAPVTVRLTWDTNVTPCAPIDALGGLLDGAAVDATNSEFVTNRLDDSGACRFPSLSLTPPEKSGPRVVTFSDGRSTVAMTITTLGSASVRPDGALATARAGDRLQWTVFAPPEGLASWKVEYGVPGTLLTTWAEGLGPAVSAISVLVPSGTPAGMGREVSVSWRVNAVVTGCENAQRCLAELSGRHAYPLEVVP